MKSIVFFLILSMVYGEYIASYDGYTCGDGCVVYYPTYISTNVGWGFEYSPSPDQHYPLVMICNSTYDHLTVRTYVKDNIVVWNTDPKACLYTSDVLSKTITRREILEDLITYDVLSDVIPNVTTSALMNAILDSKTDRRNILQHSIYHSNTHRMVQLLRHWITPPTK